MNFYLRHQTKVNAFVKQNKISKAYPKQKRNKNHVRAKSVGGSYGCLQLKAICQEELSSTFEGLLVEGLNISPFRQQLGTEL